ncbi:MAG TPA: PQQ-binding-like beta-propeller repeat protein [Ktedonobacteraceae bacterium]|nr:PQQ-binding-like beta-propeller repeat protein [Ktedonobacteraceae bacterium]
MKIGASLVLIQETLYAANQDVVFALDAATGKIRWKDQSNTQTYYPVKNMLVENNIIVIIRDGFVKGVQASDDHQLWTIDQTTPLSSFGGDAVLHELHVCNVFATATILYMCLTSTPGASSNQQASFAAYALPTGKLLWNVQDAAAKDPALSFTFQNPFAPTAITKDGIFALTEPDNGDLEARSLQDGHTLWTKLGTGSYPGITVEDGRIYTETDNGELDVFTIKDGARLWTLSAISGTYWLNQTLYIEKNYDGKLDLQRRSSSEAR